MYSFGLAKRPGSGGFSWPRNVCALAIAGAWLLGIGHARADGCFVFHWDKQKDINEPTQKAIILHDKGREDMVLQVKYEGPAEDFGWLIPVPGLPEVRKGSMDCFYELSRLTQRQFHEGKSTHRGGYGMGRDEEVNIIEVKTVGAYEVAVLSTTNAASLGAWLDAHHFSFPKDKQDVLDGYVKKQWYFVAAKIDPTQNGFVLQQALPKKEPDQMAISQSARQQLANGELHPLVISFRSEKCVFPLAISAVNGKPSEVSLYLLSSEPLADRTIFDKKFANDSRELADWIQKDAESYKAIEDNQWWNEFEERLEPLGVWIARDGRLLATRGDDPADPLPVSALQSLIMPREVSRVIGPDPMTFVGGGLVKSIQVGPKDLATCREELPRLTGESWWLTKEVEVFAPEEMRDLKFEPVVPLLKGKLGTSGGLIAANYLLWSGRYTVPDVLAGAKSSNSFERRWSAWAMSKMDGTLLAAAVPALLEDEDTETRLNACIAAAHKWNAAFVPSLTKLLGDSKEDGRIQKVAWLTLKDHWSDSEIPLYRKMIEEDCLASSEAINTLFSRRKFSKETLIHFFCSTNLPVVSSAYTELWNGNLSLDEIEPLLTNSLAGARIMGVRSLTRIGDKRSVDRIVAMLRDPNDAIRWQTRCKLRLLTGQKLGPEPAAYEKWWAENKDNYTPPPP